MKQLFSFLRENNIQVRVYPYAVTEPPASNGSFSVKQAAQQLGVSKELVYKLVNEGTLPHTRIGRRITITQEQLAEYQDHPQGRFRHL